MDTGYTQTEASKADISGSFIGWVNFNVYSIVKGWVNGGLENDGFQIDHNSPSDPEFFYYSSNATTDKVPLLSVTYFTDETGLNPYWAYDNTPTGSVNTYNGNFLTSVNDFSLPGRGIPIDVTRIYNSRDNLSGIFGQKWFSNLDMQLSIKSWGAVLVDSSGTERPFMLNSDGITYTAPDNYPVQLYQSTLGGANVYRLQEATPSNTYIASLPDLIFNASGKLIQLDDGKGNATTISWQPSSILVTDPSGRTMTLSLNADGTVNQIITSAEPGQIKASYTYSNGYLTSVMYDNDPKLVVNYGWNSGLLNSLTDKNGNIKYINYNSNNQIISNGGTNLLSNPSIEAGDGGANVDNWSPTVAQDNGSIKESTTSKFGRYSLDIQSVNQTGTASDSYLYSTQSIPVKPGTQYTLSSFIKTNNLGGSSTPNPNSSKAFLNIAQLDSSGNRISWTDTRNSGVSGTTDWTQNKLTLTTASNTANIVVYLEIQHDSTHFGGDAYFDGVQLELGQNATNFAGHTDIRYGNDGSYEAAWVTSPDGELTEYKNNNYGTPAAVITDPRDTNKSKAETDLTWNPSDHLQSLTTPVQVNGKTGKSYSYGYDAVGNMTSATDPLGRSTSMNYYNNHLNSLTQADGSTEKNVWDPVNLNMDTNIDQTLDSTAYSYDSAGNATQESNLLGVADNRVINSGFEQLSGNQPTSWTAYTPSGTIANQVERKSAPFNDSTGTNNVLHINPGTNPYAYQWSSNYINLNSSGQDYFTISGYMRTDQSTGTSGGACLNVYWYNSSYSQVGSTVVLFNVRNTQWKQYVSTIKSPANASYAKVMAVTYGAYDGYFDNIQFEKSQIARGYNIIENSSFENAITQWNTGDSYSSITSDPNAYSGSYDAQINRSTTGSSYVRYNIPIPVNPSQSYTLLGFLKTSNVVTGPGAGGARMYVKFYDSSNNLINSYATKQVTATMDWTKYVLAFKPPANSVTAQVWLQLDNATGSATFDNIRLSYGNLTAANTYDSNGNYVTSTTDQLGNAINSQVDAYGQKLQVTTPGNEVTKYTYDDQENLKAVTDNAGNTTTYNLDSNGNILSSALSSGINNYNNMTFSYDRNNNLSSITDADNNTTQFNYDEDGRIINKTNPNGTSIISSYDSYGNLNQASLSSGTTYNYGYDLEGHVTSAAVSNGPTITNTYDAVGNLTGETEKESSGNTITTINGPTSAAMYSSLDQLLGFNLVYKNNSSNPIAFSYNYNKAGSTSSIGVNGSSINLNYNENNNLISKNNPNSTNDNISYNEANQITDINTTNNSNTVLWSDKYSYDFDGKILNVNGTRNNGASFSAAYTYNNSTEKLNRLTQAQITDGSNNYTFNYSYGPAGNITSMDVANGTNTPSHLTFNYDADNRITNSGFAYDKNGNLTAATINSKSYQYGYDAANRLITVKDGNGSTIATYTYGADGNRLTKTVNNVTTTYHYAMGQLLYETISTDPSNVIHALYVWSPQGKLQAVSNNYVIGGTSNTFYYYHYNAHGDVIAVTDANGNIFRQYTYDPYGNIISVKDGSGNAIDINNDSSFNEAYTYAGYRYDHESGLYFLNSRYYAPGIGRFLTKDTQMNAKNPQTLNLYVYAGDNPVNNIDKDGHEPWYLPLVVAFLAENAELEQTLSDGVEKLGEYISAGIEKMSTALEDMSSASENTASEVGESEPTVTASEGASKAGKGFNSFKELKNDLGSPGENRQWHHIVEQSQIKRSGFEANQIQNTDNIISVDKVTHSQISGFYSSKPEFAQGLRVRDWLTNQSFQEQYQFGMDVLKRFGVIK